MTVIALGVGVAAPTVMYSLLVAATRPIPLPEPEALVHVGRRYTESIVRGTDAIWLRPLVDETERGEGSLASVGAFSLGQHDVSGAGGFAERRRAAAVTPGVFETLRTEPALGRGITESDVARLGAEPVVVISDALWRERFGADPGVLGGLLRVDGTPHTVVGVMPRGFAFPDNTELWRPLELPTTSGRTAVELVGRLSTSGSLEALTGRVHALLEGLRASGDVADERVVLTAQPWSDRRIDRNGRRMLHVMVVVVSFVLVIACANVVHILLARALGRRRAIALRLALGAGRWRVVRQQWIEAAVLAGIGGLTGLALASVGVRSLSAAMAHRLSWGMELRLDLEVLAFASGLVAFAALVTGLAPALHATRLGAGHALAVGGGPRATVGHTAGRLTGALVVAEVSLACTLLVLGGLLTRGALRNLELTDDLGAKAVVVAGYALRVDRYGETEVIGSFHRSLVEEASAHRDVAVAAVSSHLPAVYAPMAPVEIEGDVYDRPEDRPTTHVVHVTPGFLDALGVGPVRGRDLAWADGAGEPAAALVNEPFVRRHVRGDPLGQRVRVADREGADAGEWVRVVGVVPSLALDNGFDFDDTGVYLPIAHQPPRSAHLLLRPTRGATARTLALVARAAGARLDADLALADVGSLHDRIAGTQDMERLFATLFGLFGLSGLALAGVGLYGLLAFTVGQRVRELGVRSALGARPRALVWTAVRGSTLQIGIGLVIGLGLAAGVAPHLGTFFLGYDARDPVAYVAVAATLLTTGWLAALAPARRASSLDVAEVLRAE
jgi:predicted permease